MVKTETIVEVPYPVADVWPVMSRTDWINRAVGLPPVTYEVTKLEHGGTRTIAKAKFYGQELRWEENPFEWVEDQFYFVQRLFEKGPLREIRCGIDFSGEQLKSSLRIWSEIQPRNALGKLFATAALGPKATRDMAGLVRHLDEHLRGREKFVLPKLERSAVNQRALQAGLEKLRALNLESIDRLATMLQEDPDVEISRIRPLALAREWNLSERAVLKLFLEATRAGLLDLSWEVLCPNCRSSRQPLTRTLQALQREMHCEACQIQYDAQFDRSVELKFAVHPNVRSCQAHTYCLAGPGAKPHIVSQLIIPPKGQRRARLPRPDHAGLRLRSPQVREPMIFDNSSLNGTIHLTSQSFIHTAAEHPETVFRNDFDFPVVVILEKILWSADILTAARVTNLQEFRDLFSREVLSPNEQIIVGQQTILFTDLRGSTAMYCGIGDAPAYALVREHFDVLRDAIAGHQGAIVKTIGDAVMATFSNPADALNAVREMHRKLQERLEQSGAPPLSLKSSLHLGACLAVNANDKLDYFGTTINLGARLVDCCGGGDVTLSDEFYHRPETREFLDRYALGGEAKEVKFRGFDLPMQVWKVQLI